MEKQYLLSVDQSTQGTKALLFDQEGNLICRGDRPHRQIINDAGWVSHDLNEIYSNTLKVVRDVIEKAGIRREQVAGLGISNQRETSAVWDRTDGHPLADAIVWQCSRAKDICARVEESGKAEWVRRTTGINLSPYFPASKLAWFMENVKEAPQKASEGTLCLGTIDSYLVYRLTGGTSFKTDYSNASRTQLFNIHSLEWDEGLCSLFGIPVNALAQVCDSNAWFGDTDLEGYLDNPIPIHGVLGDSHGALFGQGCLEKGMIKTTYGTGSSIMMNIGDKPVISTHGVAASLAWGMDGRVNYVLEGNINAPEDRDLIIHEMRIDRVPEELDRAGEHSFYCGVMDLHFGPGAWRISCHPPSFGGVRVSGLPSLWLPQRSHSLCCLLWFRPVQWPARCSPWSERRT